MKRIIFAIVTTALMLLGCRPASTDTNGNEQLYGTEWVSETGEGLRFFKDDSVQFFSTLAEARGTFSYDSGSKVITFQNLRAEFQSFTTEMTHARIVEDGSMELYWHKNDADYYSVEILYRRK